MISENLESVNLMQKYKVDSEREINELVEQKGELSQSLANEEAKLADEKKSK